MKRFLLLACLLCTAPLGCKDEDSSSDDEVEDERDEDREERDAGPPGVIDETPLGSGNESRNCEPTSCSELDVQCGKVADGCGKLLDCGACDDDERCGVIERNVCTRLSDLCQPIDEEEACEGKECGVEGDGCGGTYDCGSCDDDEICGVVTAFECGQALELSDDACPAKIESCSDVDAECGLVGNGCGGLIDCEDEVGGCDDDRVCGVEQPGQCGNGECTPVSEADACEDKACGKVSDGCSGSYDCGECDGAELCGVIEAFQCDLPPSGCEPRTPEQACDDKECGVVYDGCGSDAENVIDCAELNGGCDGDETCGASEPFQCGVIMPPDCTPADSCADLGWECGIAVDGCGDAHDCASEGRECDDDFETCIGGIGAPALCESGLQGEVAEDCEICDAIPQCGENRPPTTLTGRVFTPGRNDADEANQLGVPNAFVYILRENDADSLPPIPSGVPVGGAACDLCNDQDLGPVLEGATANALGEFTLRGNIPVGEEFLLVVKIGKFRRAIPYTVDPEDACGTSAVPRLTTRLPRDMEDGIGVNLPRVAIVTGQIDAMECVFEKMGISTAEFGQPGDDGAAAERIHLYGEQGARLPDGFTPEEDLHEDEVRLMSYDMVVFDCQGSRFEDTDTSDARVRQYVNRGGRIFASHLSYTWLWDNGTEAYDPSDPYDTGLSAAATWNPDAPTAIDFGTGYVSVGRPNPNPERVEEFARWLIDAGVANESYEIDLIDPRDVAASVGVASEEYIYRQIGAASTSAQQFSFNTPYGAPEGALCGRVTFSGFHVSSGGDPTAFSGVTFPDHCNGSTGLDADLTNQEKILAFMLFDLANCVSTGAPERPECTPAADCTGRCGVLPDGCGGVVNCSCPGDDSCLPGGVCSSACEPTSCAAEGAECGEITNGCGGEIDCGECEPPLVCGGGGEPHKCGGACLPLECQDVDAECGMIGDGCDDAVDCGECPSGQFCVSNRCEGCQPLSCEDTNSECGLIGDGCGDSVDCGECPEGEACGVEEPNRCGPTDSCEPRECSDIDAECGLIGDGCGDSVDCGECPDDEICGIDEPFKCGKPPECTPDTCEDVDAECGMIGDGCGDAVDCGMCPGGMICGVEESNQCASRTVR